MLAFAAACALLLGAIAWLLGRELLCGGGPSPHPPPVRPAQEPAGTLGQPPAAALRPSVTLVDAPEGPVAPLAPGADGDAETPGPPRDGMIPATGNSTAVPANPVRWAGQTDDRAARRKLDVALAALRTDPAHPIALRDAVDALVKLGQWSAAADAIALLRKQEGSVDDTGRKTIVESTGLPQDWALAFEQGTCLMRAKRWFDATQVLRALVQQAPEHHRAWFNLAVAEQALGHLADARAAWDRVIALAPDDAAARASRGEVLLDLREWDAAAADFRAVLAQAPAEAVATEVRWNLSLALWKGSRVAEARAELVALVEQQPRHVPALNRLAEIDWELCRQQDEARGSGACQKVIEWCQRSLAINAAQPEVQRLLGAGEERVSTPRGSP